ncbi:hypothetical protein SAMN05444281_1898 [Wenyingzhuangia marina]|uniref:VanZ like family protein n=2 Tax=Wenyingzhuangia marina TaxID=1195760 RepID=A0A1M5VLK6_9FLAO|nr:hypothetical protein GCM10011397_12880 [Wenyingzhuangia marina]SHH76107.1 hypothetical protein SAMN05444281_1898 [Wenyingzhuangia marina]
MKVFRFFKPMQLIYFVLVIIALTVYSLKQHGYQLPLFINNFLNDLLCLPIVLGIITRVIQFLKKDSEFKLPIGFIICLATYYSIYFEYYQPRVNNRYTSDWIDVLLYFIGGFSYFFISRYKTNKKSI